MSEETFVRYCSPTLAGIKTANLFSGCFADEEEMREGIRRLNGILVKKGIRVLPLKYHEGRALIYVYRPMRLRQDLERADVRSLLQECGYICGAPEHCIVQLMRRLAEEREYSWEFPHEIGLFLGIPPEDVRGFIENRAEGYKCVGEWKVYGDVEQARKIFAKYRKCTEVYCVQLARGTSMERLAVAV